MAGQKKEKYFGKFGRKVGPENLALFKHFSGRLPGSPKRHFGTLFGHFSAISRFDPFYELRTLQSKGLSGVDGCFGMAWVRSVA